MTTRKPTAPQAALIRYFDGGPRPQLAVNQATHRVCRDNGWIEPIEEFPFHRTTDEGRNALAPTPISGAARRKGQEANAAALHADGWLLVAPERAAEVRALLGTSSSYTENWADAEWRPTT